uniref:Uncharacterized protein n=1 Tax=Knipowitschia caucasica TaxID=637954 RepID=A0AAV2L1R4_KNICA
MFEFGSKNAFFILIGAFLVGSWADLGSLTETTLRPSDQDTNSIENHGVHTINLTAHLHRSKRSSNSTRLDILGPSHLSALQDLLSDRKSTVRLGLRIAVRGPNELVEQQLRLLLSKESGLYNAGDKAGLFSMRVLGIKKVSSS